MRLTGKRTTGAASLQIGLATDSRAGLKYVTHASASPEVTHQMIRSGFRCDAVSKDSRRDEYPAKFGVDDHGSVSASLTGRLHTMQEGRPTGYNPRLDSLCGEPHYSG